ncbi:transposase family protein [Streptomyces milbemycinicus]|uniref:transposase family protein n=1 Tax=Streptomyces milbemycinicus TaxID=476552 RepID=UPI0033F1A627
MVCWFGVASKRLGNGYLRSGKLWRADYPFPHLTQVVVNGVVRIGRSVRISAICSAPTARCPGCGTVSARVHNRYARRLADTAVAGQETAIELEVRRFFRDHASCGKKTFDPHTGWSTSPDALILLDEEPGNDRSRHRRGHAGGRANTDRIHEAPPEPTPVGHTPTGKGF